MKSGALVVALIGAFAGQAVAQQSMTSYTPAQRAAVQSFMQKNRMTFFKAESNFSDGDADALRSARQTFGKNFRPYLTSRDFNGDKRPDFAVLLGVRSLQRLGRIVIFNGTTGGEYRVAFQTDVPLGPADFLGYQGVLSFGTYESHWWACFKPIGRGYRMGDCN